MQNLREQLLKAGIITQEQHKKAEESQRDKGRRGGRPQGQDRGKRPDQRDAKGGPKNGGANGEREKNDVEKALEAQKPKISKKALMKQPLNRMLDLSDPKVLRIFQAIEEHRVREETKGDQQFHFVLRDGRVRKMFVKQSVADGLEKGELAIVESGEQDRHVIVRAEALAMIREVDPDAIRFPGPDATDGQTDATSEPAEAELTELEAAVVEAPVVAPVVNIVYAIVE